MESSLNREVDSLIGTVLLERFIITNKFNDNGAYGVIYQAKTSDGEIYLAKISQDPEMNFKEHQILDAINYIPG
jgi:hypothetical protein